MNARLKISITGLLLAGLALAAPAVEFSVPVSHGPNDEDTLVPIRLDDLSGVGGIQLQLNYDPDFLAFKGVETNGTLATQFTVRSASIAGTVRCTLLRPTPAAGSGDLLHLRFRLREGVTPGSSSPLVIAERVLSDGDAALVHWDREITHVDGSFFASFSRTGDRDGDGVSDYDEQLHDGSAGYDPFHPVTNPGGGDTDVDVADSDGDGLGDGAEQIAGTIPTDPGNTFKILNDGINTRYIQLLGNRVSWLSALGRSYEFQRAESADGPFQVMTGAESIPGTGTMINFIDGDGLLDIPYFYRLRVFIP